jgi:hypothetical protein
MTIDLQNVGPLRMNIKACLCTHPSPKNEDNNTWPIYVHQSCLLFAVLETFEHVNLLEKLIIHLIGRNRISNMTPYRNLENVIITTFKFRAVGSKWSTNLIALLILRTGHINCVIEIKEIYGL